MIFDYDRILVNEGIDIETYEHDDDLINESLSKRCNGFRLLLYNKNNFNYKERTCNRCYKILLNTGFQPRDMCIIWWNNCKYRVLTTLKCGQDQRLMERGKLQDGYGYIDIEKYE